jgi:hypothetical protein
MEKLPFSPEIRPYVKPVEVGDTNKIYYDPNHPEILIRIPKDEEARFMETDPGLIKVVEKIYHRLDEMGKGLDINVAAHQFILAKETSNGPVKPMLLAKRINGNPLVPIDKNNPKTLEAVSRIAQLGLKYLDWIESSRPKSVVTDIFRPDQYITHSEESHDKLTLVDVEPRLKNRDMGVKFIEFELGMLVGSLRDSKYDNTFCSYMQHAIRALKQNRNYNEMASLINNIINAPEIYQQMSDAFLAGKEYTPPQEAIDRMRKTPLIITRELLKRLGIEKI